MNGKGLVGIVLVAVGVLVLAYQGFSYTVPKNEVDLGPLQVTKQERHNVSLPPILGALAVIGGVVVLVTNRQSD